ncbi:hypothetical protein J4557_46415 [Actinomadura nitritigenes]|uniref:Uncharacterized protein n=1 Tax=Actinomadura nitritigenes TaxID=134602 RepID=A0ABS3RFE6_9ACTN|nr:hypothetical protein [Actinomadura nitritigenes]MBO2444964.1 hypothetical protein [Actinomadura nitritigenes]
MYSSDTATTTAPPAETTSSRALWRSSGSCWCIHSGIRHNATAYAAASPTKLSPSSTVPAPRTTGRVSSYRPCRRRFNTGGALDPLHVPSENPAH